MAFTKLYLHDATTALAITLPGAGPQATSRFAAALNSTNRDASATIGVAQTSVVFTTAADTNPQSNAFRRFISPQLAAGTYTNLNFTTSLARAESNLNSNFFWQCYIGVWTPESSSYVEWNGAPSSAENTSAATQQAQAETTANVTLTVADGDVLVVNITASVEIDLGEPEVSDTVDEAPEGEGDTETADGEPADHDQADSAAAGSDADTSGDK